MVSEKLSAKYPVVIETNDASILNMGDKIAALVFWGEGDKISSKTAVWAANALKEIENEYNGLVVYGNEENLCTGNAIDLNEDSIACSKNYQSLTSTIKHFSKPVVTLMKGICVGFGYEAALNSHAVLVCPSISKFGYDLSQGFSPMGGGLTSQIIETYAKGDNVPGHDIVPFLKALLNNVYGPKKFENIYEAKAKGFLPSNASIVKVEEDIIEKGKQKALNMFNEGFEKVKEKSVVVTGTTGTAAMDITIINSYEGLFLPPALYNVALKASYIIGGGNVPKKTLVSEQQLLNLEAQAFSEIVEQKRNEVAK
jgi:hypothetical protein